MALGRTVFVAFLSAAVAMTAAAQDAKPKSEPPAVRVVLTTKFDGREVPRLDKAGKDTGARNWQGRVLEWKVGDKTLTAKAALANEFARIAADPASVRESEFRPGTKELLPVAVEPDAGVRWGEILELFDAACAAGFTDWRLVGAGTRYFVPKMVDEPIRADGAIMVPRATYNEPDDAPDATRRVFVVRQDGSIEHGGRVLFRWRPGKDDDLTDLRATLREMRAKDEKAGRLQERGPEHTRYLTDKVLIVADRWCEWRDVRRLMQALTAADVGFWKFEIAVMEAMLQPFPEEAFGAGKAAESGKR